MNTQSYSFVWLDHPFVLLFAVVFPVIGYFSYRKNYQLLASGDLPRQRHYTHTIIIQWFLAFMGIVLWQVQDRDWALLGFSLRIDGLFLLGIALVVVGAWFFVAQLQGVRRSDRTLLNALQKEFDSLKPLLPHTKKELRTFYGLSITAGIVEELLWRGYLIWYLSNYFPTWVAAVISAILFGIGHAYQGIANVPKLCLVGLVFSALYLLSGSLWLPMLLHAAMDIVQGRTAYEFLEKRVQTTGSA